MKKVILALAAFFAFANANAQSLVGTTWYSIEEGAINKNDFDFDSYVRNQSVWKFYFDAKAVELHNLMVEQSNSIPYSYNAQIRQGYLDKNDGSKAKFHIITFNGLLRMVVNDWNEGGDLVLVSKGELEATTEIAKRVKRIIANKLAVDESEIDNNASFTNDLGADSLDIVELIMELEKEFGIQIPDEEAEKISTVGQAIAYIEGAKSAAKK